MAITRLAPMLGGISGNIGGVNFAQTKNGVIMRRRSRRMHQNDARHTTIRQRMQWSRHAWRDLTEEQRTAWRQTANNFPHKNRLGLATKISGFNLFVKTNMFGYLIPDLPPVPQGLIENPIDLSRQVAWDLVNFSVASGGAKTIEFVETIPSDNVAFFVYAARTLSTAPRRSWNTFRLTEAISLAGGQKTIVNWDRVIGDPQQGEQCWVRIWQFKFQVGSTGPFDYQTFAT